MRIFGLGYDGFHDSNISVMDNNRNIIFAINEERLSSVKKDGRFPIKALSIINPSANDVLCISNLEDSEILKSFKRAGIKITPEIIIERSRIFKNINQFRKKFKKVFFYSHHDCHAASAYYFSGFRRAIVLTWDAGNTSEPWNMTVHLGKGTELKRVEQSLNADPCRDYTAITALMGFTPGMHEGKITGLSARGDASLRDVGQLETILRENIETHDSLIGEIARWQNVGSATRVPKIILNKRMIRKIRNKIHLSDCDLANAIQKLTEDRVLQKIKEINKRYHEKNICLAGGLFANVLINKKIKEMGFENIFIHPAMGDDGLSLGACARYLGSKGMSPFRLKNIFFGPKYSNKEIIKYLERYNLHYYQSDYIEKEIAEKLSLGKIVARFFGKMEYGPRALGNRSILCSAINPSVNELLNKMLKRSEFMPFAPMTLEEDSHKFYKNLNGAIYASKFMTIAFDCKKRMIEQSPAAVHIDNTARPQLVGNENLGLRKILVEYKKLTGVFSLINTSFNIHESPVVCTPDQAIKAFKLSKLDYLAMNNFMICKDANKKI